MKTWSVSFLDKRVFKEFTALPASLRASSARIFELIEENGLATVGMPYVRHLQGILWEIRASGRDGIARSLYVSTTGKTVVVVRIFQKKSQKTPHSEIELALQRATEVRL